MSVRYQEVVCAFIVRDEEPEGKSGLQLLCAQRFPDAEHFPSMYEFPGGKVDEGESHVVALKRECHEELGVEIDVVADSASNSLHGQVGACYAFDHAPKQDKRTGGIVIFKLFFYWARIKETGSQPRALASQKVEWLSAEQMAKLTFCPGDEGIIEALNAGTLKPFLPIRVV